MKENMFFLEKPSDYDCSQSKEDAWNKSNTNTPYVRADFWSNID